MERRRVEIGDARLDAVIAGSGPVTVVFENGLATALESWDGVASTITERTRTVRYDRRRAEPDGEIPVRTAADLVADLRTLLAASGINPPYLLVDRKSVV